MKRKVYASRTERKRDQVFGFWAFPLVNLVIYLITLVFNPAGRAGQIKFEQATLIVQLLPWVSNALVLLLAALFRPEFARGYFGFVAVAMLLVVGLNAVALAADFVSALAFVVPPLGCIVWIVAALFGLYQFGKFCMSLYNDWSHEDSASAQDTTENNQ